MTDAEAFREGVGRLLAEVQRIKSEGDYAAAKALFETYGIHFDPKLRDEVVARVDKLDLPSYTGFVMPKLEAVTERGRRDHRRHDLVSAGSDEADARVFGDDPRVSSMTDGPAKAGHYKPCLACLSAIGARTAPGSPDGWPTT